MTLGLAIFILGCFYFYSKEPGFRKVAHIAVVSAAMITVLAFGTALVVSSKETSKSKSDKAWCELANEQWNEQHPEHNGVIDLPPTWHTGEPTTKEQAEWAAHECTEYLH